MELTVGPLCFESSSAGGFGGFDFEEFAGADVVEVAVDGDGIGNKRVIADAGDVVEDGLLLIFDGEPFDVLAGAGAGALADIAEAARGEFGGFEAGVEEIAHDVVGEEFHAAIGVMDDEKLLGAEKFVADDEGADGVVTGAAAGVADDVGVAFGEAREFGGVERREASERGSNETSKSGYAAGSGVSIAGRGWFFWGGGLQEIPLVAIEVFEDGDGAVSLLARSFEETDAARLIGFVVAPEVVGVEKEEYAAAGLIADGEGLLRSCGFCQEKSGAVGTGRSDEEPALVAGERSVLKQAEAEFLGEELDGFIVIANNESQVRDGLGHGSGLWHLHDVECVEDRISHRGHRGIAQRARRIRKVFRGK